MGYRQWFRDTVLGICGAIFLLSGALWLIDPIEIWESPVICGFNHIKPKQAVFLDVFKPFQVVRHAPETVYIGTSRVYVGFRPEANAYNMGGSSLSLPDIRAYLRFIYSQNVPQKVFIGLDLFQFGNENMTRKRKGFSQERLDFLQKGRIAFFGEACKTNIGMAEYLKDTVESSYKNPNKKKEWKSGWDVTRGEKSEVEPITYYSYLHSFYKQYKNFVYDQESVECVQDILVDADAHGVEVVLFFNPVSVDLLALQEICGREEEFRDIKAEVAKLHPVYDFTWASPLALDREGAWLDGSHYHYPVGERMKAAMTEAGDEEICRGLTAETIDAHLWEETVQYERWAVEHSDYIQALAEAAPKKILVGTLAQYFGF